MYNKEIIKHFKNPHNQGIIKNADGVGETGNPTCGDIMKLYIKVNPKTSKIDDIKFETLGCGVAIATTSVLTDLAKGKTIKDALRITKDDIINALNGKDTIPVSKFHCSVLATVALKKAIADYKDKK